MLEIYDKFTGMRKYQLMNLNIDQIGHGHI